MKAIATFFLLIILFVQNNIIAQTIKPDSIFWDDGKVSLLSQLGPVYIITKQGSDKKEVRIVEIKKERGILVYEKEKCLHDIAIDNIEKIDPGKYPLSVMHFHPDNTPYITTLWLRLDPMFTYSDFKSVPLIKHKVEPLAQRSETKFASVGCDTIVEENGTINIVKIVEVDSKFVTYKRTGQMNGPIYVKCINNANIKRYSSCISVNFIKP